METIKSAKERAVYRLSEHYEQIEAERLVQWVFEDCFGNAAKQGDDLFSEVVQLDGLISRLIAGEPVQYVTGKAHFYGEVYKVNAHVLIPRPETEELVDWILSDRAMAHRQIDCLDIGTGSGCIAVTLKKRRKNWRLFGVEYSLDALNVTRINARQHRAPVELFRLNFLDRSLWHHLGLFDVIVSNPPYIDDEERRVMSDNVLLYEPDMALFPAGDDPLIFYAHIRDFAETHLRPGGRIYVEINEFRAGETIALFNSARTKEVIVKSDLQGKKRMIGVIYE